MDHPSRVFNRASLLLSCSLLAGAATLGSATPAAAAGQVVLYTADGLEDFYKDVLPAFEKKEGVHVAIVTAGSGEVVNRATVEKDSPKADVIVTLPPFVQQAADTHLLQPERFPADAHIPAAERAPDGAWRTFVDNYFCFAVNPDEVKTAPTTFQDLLKPAFAGKVAYSNPATAGDGMAVIILTVASFGSEDAAFNYLKALEGSVKFHTRGTGYLDVLLSRREIMVANGDLQMDLGDAAGGGLSIEPIFLSAKAGEPAKTFSLPYAIGLVAHGPNPDEGKKLIDYLLSPEVQAKVDTVYGIPARDDVHAEGKNAEVVEKAIKGVTVVPVNWTQVSEKKPAWLARFKQEVLGDSGKPAEVTAPK